MRAARFWVLLASIVLVAHGCGHGAGPVPPRIASIHPFTACSNAETVFVVRGDGFERVGKSVQVAFRAVRGTPFHGGRESRVLAEAYVESPSCIRGVLPATPTDGVVETTVSLLLPGGTAPLDSAIRLTLMPSDSDAYRSRRAGSRARLGNLFSWDDSRQRVMDADVDDRDGTMWFRAWHPNGQLAVEGRRSPEGDVETWTTWDAGGRHLETETWAPQE